MRRGKPISPSKLSGMLWRAQRWLASGHLHFLGKSGITSYVQYGAELFQVDGYYIDSLNSHREQFWKSKEMISDSGHLKLWNPFSSTLLMYAENQSLNNLWRDMPTLLIILITTWPLSHIWHMWSFSPWNTFPLASGTALSLWFPPCSLPAPFLSLCWFLLMPLTSKHWSALGVSSPTSSLCYPLSWCWISSTHKTFKCLSLLGTYQLNFKLIHPFYLPQNLEWPFKTSVRLGCSPPPNPPMALHFIPCKNQVFAMAEGVISELGPVTCLASSHSAPPHRILLAQVYLRHLAFAVSSV